MGLPTGVPDENFEKKSWPDSGGPLETRDAVLWNRNSKRLDITQDLLP